MEIWLAIMGGDEPILSVLGAYSSKELAEQTARQASSDDDWETLSFVIDEVPGWFSELHEEEPAADEDPHAPVARDNEPN